MTTESKVAITESPSLVIAQKFWEIAKKEFESVSIFEQKDACEKAFRAATEAVDVLLASRGIKILVGDAIAHSQRAEALNKLSEIENTIFELANYYSRYKDHLHGFCFYGTHNPLKYRKLFFSISEFIEKVAALLE